MKVKDIVKKAEKDLKKDIEAHVIGKAKNMLIEIKATEALLAEMQRQYDEFLDKELDGQFLLEM